MKTSSSFKFDKFFLNWLTLHFWRIGLNPAPLPEASTLTLVEVTPYPIPPLSILTEVIVPEEFIWGVSFASDPTPNTTKSGGEL